MQFLAQGGVTYFLDACVSQYVMYTRVKNSISSVYTRVSVKYFASLL